MRRGGIGVELGNLRTDDIGIGMGLQIGSLKSETLGQADVVAVHTEHPIVRTMRQPFV